LYIGIYHQLELWFLELRRGKREEEGKEEVKEKGENGRGTHVQIIGTADLGIPPPSSLILIVISSLPSTTTTLIGGN
jgi:hypothetical protein